MLPRTNTTVATYRSSIQHARIAAYRTCTSLSPGSSIPSHQYWGTYATSAFTIRRIRPQTSRCAFLFAVSPHLAPPPTPRIALSLAFATPGLSRLPLPLARSAPHVTHHVTHTACILPSHRVHSTLQKKENQTQTSHKSTLCSLKPVCFCAIDFELFFCVIDFGFSFSVCLMPCSALHLAARRRARSTQCALCAGRAASARAPCPARTPSD
eukprot:508517-Rhodomonas_salina.1